MKDLGNEVDNGMDVGIYETGSTMYEIEGTKNKAKGEQ